MADLLDEVDDMMRQERAQKFWHENGKYIIAFIVMTIVFTGAMSIYRGWNQSVQENQTSAILMAIEAPDFPDNIAELAKNLRPDLRGIALLNGASAYMQAGENDKAAALYTQLSEDKKVKDELRSLGTLMSVRLTSDTTAADDKINRLQPLVGDKGDIWQAHAMLETALILANEKQDKPAALATLNNLLQLENLSPSLEQNAENLHHLYTIDVTKGEAQ